MISVEHFKNEVAALAQQVGVEPKEVHIRKMTRKWASCSTRGRLTFSTMLLSEVRSKRREVVLHELLHLRYPNHGKMFRTALKGHLHELN